MAGSRPRPPQDLDDEDEEIPEEPVEELDFGDDEPPPRVGDLRSSRTSSRIPPSRVRHAGLTGGETSDEEDVTADDLSPESLLHEDGGPGIVEEEPEAADQALREVDAIEIGGGSGLDEAELAEQQPLAPPRKRGRPKRS